VRDPSHQHAIPSDRFQTLRHLGEGGMGIVQLVHDRVRGEDVAQKRLVLRGPLLDVRFKREFRVVERLHHPRLVRLYELGEDEQGLFFTMEPVLGDDVLGYYRGSHAPPGDREAALAVSVVRANRGATLTDPDTPIDPPAPPRRIDRTSVGTRAGATFVDLERLETILAQLLEALAFLHQNGVVHRDLKPSNVRVTPEGALKVLDFGVLAEREAPGAPLESASFVGTPGFMAPEQIRGEKPTPASDLYALGAMIFLLVSGRPVFTGDRAEVLAQHLDAAPPRLADVADVPPILDETCAALLAKDPAARPGVEAVARALLPGLRASRFEITAADDAASALVGRATIQRDLATRIARALGGSFEAVVLSGPTGAGKTSLAAYAAEHAAARGMLVLRGRGRHHERVPFNAVDGAIDALSIELASRPHAPEPAEIAGHRAIASLAFPVLRMPDEAPKVTSRSVRSDVFEAVQALLADTARRHGGLVLFLDDLQWADRDSSALLEAIVAAAPPGVLFLATIRDDVGPNVADAWLTRDETVARIAVPPLDDASMAAIVRRAAASAGAPLDDEAVHHAAIACAGRPFLAEVAGRELARSSHSAADGPAAALAGLVSSVDDAQRAALTLLHAADGWMTVGELAALLDTPAGAVDRWIVELESSGLVRRAAAHGGHVALYHDVVSAILASTLDAGALARAHATLGAWLERCGDRAPHRLVRHWLAAGDARRAGSYAEAAAQQATAQRAYSLAADLYEIAIDHAPDPPAGAHFTWSLARADALERCGRYAEAASSWASLEEKLTGDARIEARLRQAHDLLASGESKVGRARRDDAHVGAGELPRGPGGRGALRAWVRVLIGPPRPTPPRLPSPPAAALARSEIDVRLTILVGYFDPFAGMRALRRTRERSDRSGAREHAAWCDYVFAYWALFMASRRGPVPLAARYRAAAEARLAGQRVEAPQVIAYPYILDSVGAMRDGRWADARAAADRICQINAEAGFEGRMEDMLGSMQGCHVELFAQDFARLEPKLRKFRITMRDHGDSAAVCQHQLVEAANAHRLARFAESSEITARIRAAWPDHDWTVLRAFFEISNAFFDARTDPIAARRRVAEAQRRVPFGVFSSMYGGHLASAAALAEALAIRSGDRDASPRKVARWARICAKAPPFGHTGGLRALAYVADARGETARAVALFARAEGEAMAFGQRLDAGIARYQRGRRVGGDEGADLMQSARTLVTDAACGAGVLDEDPV
jgi:hypothetical protein